LKGAVLPAEQSISLVLAPARLTPWWAIQVEVRNPTRLGLVEKKEREGGEGFWRTACGHGEDANISFSSNTKWHVEMPVRFCKYAWKTNFQIPSNYFIHYFRLQIA